MDQLAALGITRHQAMTMASIVEKEAKLPEERPVIAAVYYNRLAKGGHFAAWEQPKLFSEEIRATFRSLRSSQKQATR